MPPFPGQLEVLFLYIVPGTSEKFRQITGLIRRLSAKKGELTRTQVASLLIPKVSARQLQSYLNIARKYLPEFRKFTNRKTGGLDGYAKLYEHHVPQLQEIRSLAREHTLAEIEVQLQQRLSSKSKENNNSY